MKKAVQITRCDSEQHRAMALSRLRRGCEMQGTSASFGHWTAFAGSMGLIQR